MEHTTLDNRRIGGALIALGVAFIAMRLLGVTLAGLFWPLWVLVPGAVMLWFGFRGERAHLGWNIPGALVGGTGAILFLLNLTGQWESWAYAWTLYPVFVGLALHQTGKRNANEGLIVGGHRTATTGLYMLLGFGIFFELLIFGGLDWIAGPLLPLIFIAMGIFFMKSKSGCTTVAKPPFAKFKRKPKRVLSDPVTGINPDLRRRMDEALAKDEYI